MWISTVFSWLWIASSIVICLVAAFALLRQTRDAVMGLVGLAVAFVLYARAERVVVWPEILALAGAAAIALVLRWWWGTYVGKKRGRRYPA